MNNYSEMLPDIAERRRRKYKTEYNRTVQYLRVSVGLLMWLLFGSFANSS
jgi:hypothetical protein